MRAFFTCLVVLMMTSSSVLAEEPQSHISYSQMAAYPGGPYNPKMWEERNQLLRSVLDPSNGRARFAAQWAASYAQLDPDSVRTHLELTPWLESISQRIKAQREYKSADMEANRCLPKDASESLCMMFTFHEDGQVSERLGHKYNIRKVDEVQARKKLRKLARRLIYAVCPFPDPPNAYPLGRGLLFEFYISAEHHLDFTIQPF